MDKYFIHYSDSYPWRNGQWRQRTVWFECDKLGRRHYFWQWCSSKRAKPHRITDRKEKALLEYTFQRYYPDGSRI